MNIKLDRTVKPGSEKLLLMSVIPGEWYVDEKQGHWHYYDSGDGDADEYDCVVCDEPITGEKFSGKHYGDDDKAHFECVHVLVPMDFFGAREDLDKLRQERNLVRPTEDIACEGCAVYGDGHVVAVVLRPMYPFGGGVTTYIPLCQECADQRTGHPELSDIGIIARGMPGNE